MPMYNRMRIFMSAAVLIALLFTLWTVRPRTVQAQTLIPTSASCTGSLSGNFCSYTPTQLGVSALAYTSNGTTAESAIIDARGVKGWTLLFNCTSTVNVQLNNKIEDGTTNWNNANALGAVGTGNTSWSVNAGGTQFATQGTLVATIQNLPQRAISFQFQNTNATPGTCTARLFAQY